MDFMDTAAAVLLGNLLTLAAYFAFKRMDQVYEAKDLPWWVIGTVLLLAFLIAGTAYTHRPGARAETPVASAAP